jgi:vacuolar-type H+-ATPase subunit B/Vma2
MTAATSTQALDEHKAEGNASRQRIAVERFLRTIYPASVTRNAISRALRLPIQSVTGRVNELLATGVVIEPGARIRDPITRRSCKLVASAPDLFA